MVILRWLHILSCRIRALMNRPGVEQELDEEFNYHLDRSTQEFVVKGMSPQEAKQRALRDLDGIVRRKEECRDMRHLNLVDDFMRDVRYAARMMWRSPGFTSVAVLSLALGIGANTAVFTFINAIFLTTLAVPNPHELVQVMPER